MADPGVAAPAYPLAAYFMDELGLDGGKEYFQTLFHQGLKVYPKNPQVVQALASGEGNGNTISWTMGRSRSFLSR